MVNAGVENQDFRHQISDMFRDASSGFLGSNRQLATLKLSNTPTLKPLKPFHSQTHQPAPQLSTIIRTFADSNSEANLWNLFTET